MGTGAAVLIHVLGVINPRAESLQRRAVPDLGKGLAIEVSDRLAGHRAGEDLAIGLDRQALPGKGAGTVAEGAGLSGVVIQPAALQNELDPLFLSIAACRFGGLAEPFRIAERHPVHHLFSVGPQRCHLDPLGSLELIGEVDG